MTENNELSQVSRTLPTAQDSVVAGGLIAASAWGPWLAELNQVLSALSLAIGVLLGSARLWMLFRGRNKRERNKERQ
jgi:hypothetical protein